MPQGTGEVRRGLGDVVICKDVRDCRNLPAYTAVIAHVSCLVLCNNHPGKSNQVLPEVVRAVLLCCWVSDEPWWVPPSPFWFATFEDPVHDLLDPEWIVRHDERRESTMLAAH